VYSDLPTGGDFAQVLALKLNHWLILRGDRVQWC
jgi:hypothetical protein